ncbi:hypothetical protein X777_08287 [Ooceraea biroi]|uniref:Uncharacterized protein n=1 Tax=Ooceraea biroi TaxID=2015173 RepID=A0A026WYD5_OOCBI|nr:hypothetical protein X777_08287 [Ooceraea biroi]
MQLSEGCSCHLDSLAARLDHANCLREKTATVTVDCNNNFNTVRENLSQICLNISRTGDMQIVR